MILWWVRVRIPERTAAPARKFLDLLDRATLPLARRRLREPLPIPPRLLRARVGTAEPELFLSGGAESARQVLAGLGAAGVDSGAEARVLDFGCGCGRVARHLATAMPGVEYHGCDVDAPAIEWARRNLPWGRFEVNSFNPPLVYSDATFQAVFSVSIFTHLSREDQLAWLRELRRVLAPGGVALLSIHGPSAASRTWWGQGLTMEAANEINVRTSRLDEEGFFFVPYADLESGEKFTGVSGSYGNSFQSHEWTQKNWGPLLRVEGFLPGAKAGDQDFVIARKF